MRPPLLELLAAYHSGRTDFPLARLSSSRLDRALECGLAPVVARCCADDPDAPSNPLWSTVLGSDLAARVVAEDEAQATVELIEACAPRVGPLTLLKGIWLGQALHPEPHLRPMRDIDVMVSGREAAREVERVLVELGYVGTRPEEEFLDCHHLVPYRHPVTQVLVEVHHALFAVEGPRGTVSFPADRVRDHLRPATFRGRSVLRLSNELLLAYLSAHWARSQDVVDGAASVVILLDLPALVKDVDWKEALRLLDRPVPASATLLLLSYLQSHGMLALDSWLLPAIRQRQRAFGRANLALAQWIMDRWLVDGRPFGRVLTTSRNLRIVWMGLFNPRPAFVNLVSLPWALLPHRWRAVATPLARPLARTLGVELRKLDP